MSATEVGFSCTFVQQPLIDDDKKEVTDDASVVMSRFTQAVVKSRPLRKIGAEQVSSSLYLEDCLRVARISSFEKADILKDPP